jgi:superfamily II DNA helicase RecQ
MDAARSTSVQRTGGQVIVDYKELLSEEEFALFRRLRDLRKSVAEAEGVPVYAICTNRQLADIARRKPSSMAELCTIEGIGEGKSVRYGERFLHAIAEVSREKVGPTP